MTPWTVTHQVPLSMGFPRQEYWSGLQFSSPGDLPDPGHVGLLYYMEILYCLSHRGWPKADSNCPSQTQSTVSISDTRGSLTFSPPCVESWLSATPLIRTSQWKWNSLSHVWLFETPWTAACQAPPSMGFTRQEYWSGVPFSSPGDLPDPGIKSRSPALQADALPSEPPGKLIVT